MVSPRDYLCHRQHRLESCCWAIRHEAWASNWMAAMKVSIAAGGYGGGGHGLASRKNGAYNRPVTAWQTGTRVKKTAKAAHNSHDHKHCVEDALAAAERLCADKDLRFTPLRRRVLELILSSHKPVGAYALLDQLRNEDLGSAPPTVYRALDFLIENGLIHRIERMNAFIGCSRRRGASRLLLICGDCQRRAARVASPDDQLERQPPQLRRPRPDLE
jgi:Fur family zinc uptake transcriptional regulator